MGLLAGLSYGLPVPSNPVVAVIEVGIEALAEAVGNLGAELRFVHGIYRLFLLLPPCGRTLSPLCAPGHALTTPEEAQMGLLRKITCGCR